MNTEFKAEIIQVANRIREINKNNLLSLKQKRARSEAQLYKLGDITLKYEQELDGVEFDQLDALKELCWKNLNL